MAYFYGLLNHLYNVNVCFIGMAKQLCHSHLIERVNQNGYCLIHTLIEQACYFHHPTAHCRKSSVKYFFIPSVPPFRPFYFLYSLKWKRPHNSVCGRAQWSSLSGNLNVKFNKSRNWNESGAVLPAQLAYTYWLIPSYCCLVSGKGSPIYTNCGAQSVWTVPNTNISHVPQDGVHSMSLLDTVIIQTHIYTSLSRAITRI